MQTAGSPWKRKLSAVITHTISQGGSYEIFFFFNIQRCIYKHCRNKRRSHTMVHQCDHEFITAVGRPDFGSRAVGRQHFLFHLFRQRLSKILPPQAFRFLQAKKTERRKACLMKALHLSIHFFFIVFTLPAARSPAFLPTAFLSSALLPLALLSSALPPSELPPPTPPLPEAGGLPCRHSRWTAQEF